MSSIFELPPITDFPVKWTGLPILHEDDGDPEMGESLPHSRTINILANGLEAHFCAGGYGVVADLNLYYTDDDPTAYVSPDVMVVPTAVPLDPSLSSYRIGVHGPAPILTIEVLSARSHQQNDLKLKPIVYAGIGVREYLLVDITGRFMKERLLMNRRDATGNWVPDADRGDGVVSELGFQVIIDVDGEVRRKNAATGVPYLRPLEAYFEQVTQAEARIAAELRAEAEAQARREAQAQAASLKAELDRLRQQVKANGDGGS